MYQVSIAVLICHMVLLLIIITTNAPPKNLLAWGFSCGLTLCDFYWSKYFNREKWKQRTPLLTRQRGQSKKGHKFNFIKCKQEGPALLSEFCFYDYYRETAFHILLSLSIKQLQNFIFDIQVCIKFSAKNHQECRNIQSEDWKTELSSGQTLKSKFSEICKKFHLKPCQFVIFCSIVHCRGNTKLRYIIEMYCTV